MGGGGGSNRVLEKASLVIRRWETGNGYWGLQGGRGRCILGGLNLGHFAGAPFVGPLCNL